MTKVAALSLLADRRISSSLRNSEGRGGRAIPDVTGIHPAGENHDQGWARTPACNLPLRGLSVCH